jgi:hypothetical protein
MVAAGSAVNSHEDLAVTRAAAAGSEDRARLRSCSSGSCPVTSLCFFPSAATVSGTNSQHMDANRQSARRDVTVAATDDDPPDSARARFPLEVAVVWALFAVVTIEIAVTYSRLPAGELYHVSRSGLAGGASRALVFLNFPLALVAIPILVLLAGRLRGVAPKIVAVVGGILSAAVFWPGVVTESDLDARPVNAIAALGVAIAVALTAFAAWRLGRPSRRIRLPGDALRIVLAAIVLVLGVPWMAADLGFHFAGVPVLGTLYQTGELRTQPGDAVPHPAVHFGHHHGMDGVLLVLSALLLSRLVASIARRWLSWALGAYLALMFCYGAGNLANDYWLEQVVKRGWTSWEIPGVTTPKASVAWAVIVVCAIVLWALSMPRVRRAPGPPAPSPTPEPA